MLPLWHMYFFNFKGLVQHLRAERDTERESYYYILGFALTSQVFRVLENGKSQSSRGEPWELIWLVVVSIVSAVICWLAIRTLYYANSGDHGKKFVSRLLALSWVAGWQYVCVIVPFSIIAIADMKFGTQSMLTLYFLPGVFLVTAIYFFVKVLKGFQEINRPVPPESGQ